MQEASLGSASQEIAQLQDERRGQAAALQQQALELAAYERQVRVSTQKVCMGCSGKS